MTQASDTGGPATYAHTQALEHLIAEALGDIYESTSGGTDRVKRAVESLMSEARRTLEPSLLARVAPVIEQLSELAERFDDALTNYLRRFLLEARINAILDPMLEQVERGAMPDEAEARAKLSEMAGLIDRAMQAGQRGLPPGTEKSKL